MFELCPICKKDMRGKIKYHMKKFHSDIKWDDDGFNFYFDYLHPEQDRKCPYCGSDRKMSERWNRARDTCSSKECKSKFSAIGSKTQIETEGKKLWVEKRSVHLHKVRPEMSKEILSKVNKSQRAYYMETGYKTIQEGLLYEGFLQTGFYWFEYQDYTFHHSHGNSPHFNCIMDFSIPKAKLCIEIDGSSHKRKLELDKSRDDYRESFGWRTLRFTNEDIDYRLKEVISEIYSYLDLNDYPFWEYIQVDGIAKPRRRSGEDIV